MSFPATRPTLLARLREGGNAAWEEFFGAYAGPSLEYLATMGLGREDAEDVFQEAMLKLSRDGIGFDPEHGVRFRSFLMSVLRHRLLDRRRYERRQRRDTGRTVPGDVPASADRPELGSVLETALDPGVRHFAETRVAVDEALLACLGGGFTAPEREAYRDWFWNGNDATDEAIASRHGLRAHQLRYLCRRVDAWLGRFRASRDARPLP